MMRFDTEMWICEAQYGIVAGAALVPVMIGSIVASTAMSAMSAIQQGNAQSAQANYQAQVAQNNAILAQRQSAATAADALTTQSNAAIAGKQLLGREIASEGANGADVDSGSNLNITSDTAANNQLNQLVIGSNAQRQEYADAISANNSTAQAGADRIAGQNALTAGTTGAIGSVLSGAGSVATRWYQINNNTGSNSFNNPVGP